MENLQKLHPRAAWMFFIRYLWRPIFFLLIFSPMWIIFIGAYITSPFAQGRKLFYEYVSFWLAVLIIIIIHIIMSYIWSRLAYRFYGYQLTNNAVKIERGVIWKRYVSIPYERIQNIDIYRGIIARFLRLSDIHIQTAGFSGGGITEGRLPGLNPKVAEELREKLINKIKEIK